LIIDIDRGSKDGYAKYLTDRDPDSYTIIDGNLDLFELSAEYFRKKGNENPYYRVLLSFDEEHLTLSDMTEIYNSFKDKFLKNYDLDEHQIFSVIHWDDEKPHIHMGILTNSMINEKQLRVMRGFADVPRVDSIGEMLNYEFNLKSYRDSISIFKTTPEQKTRNWKAKKGSHWYGVEDDDYQRQIVQLAKGAKTFKDFDKSLKRTFPGSKIRTDANTIGEKVFSISRDRAFTSFLFSEKWFNSNIKMIHEDDLINKTVSIKRDSYEEYQARFERTTQAHKLDLEQRNIHDGLLEYKLKNSFVSLDTSNISIEEINTLKLLNLGSKRDRAKFLSIFTKISQSVQQS